MFVTFSTLARMHIQVDIDFGQSVTEVGTSDCTVDYSTDIESLSNNAHCMCSVYTPYAVYILLKSTLLDL